MFYVLFLTNIFGYLTAVKQAQFANILCHSEFGSCLQCLLPGTGNFLPTPENYSADATNN